MTCCIGPVASMGTSALATSWLGGSGEVGGGSGISFLRVRPGFLRGSSAAAGWIGSAFFGALGPGIGSFFFGSFGLPPGAGGWGSSGITGLGAGPFLFGLSACPGGWGSSGAMGPGVGAFFEVTFLGDAFFGGVFCGGSIASGELCSGTLAGSGFWTFGFFSDWSAGT